MNYNNVPWITNNQYHYAASIQQPFRAIANSDVEQEPWEPFPDFSLPKSFESPSHVNRALSNLCCDTLFCDYQSTKEKILQNRLSNLELGCQRSMQNNNGSKSMPISPENIGFQQYYDSQNRLQMIKKKEQIDNSLGSNFNGVSDSPTLLSNLLTSLNTDQNTNFWHNQIVNDNSILGYTDAYSSLNATTKLRKIEERPLTMSPPSSSGASPKEHHNQTGTDLVSLMEELALVKGDYENQKASFQNLSTPFQSPPSTPQISPTKGCVFCKNNGYHSTFYKAHVLKDDRGHCRCPVLRTYICPLCGESGDLAHTLKYCPKNTVTRGDPISAGLPPGKVTNWREVATKMVNHHRM